MNKDQFGMEQRSNAWYEVVNALDAHVEGWLDNGSTAIRAAVNTIEKLAASAETNSDVDSEFTTDYAVVLTKEEVNQLLNDLTQFDRSATIFVSRFLLDKLM
jgi:hypothetical protein